MIQCYCGKDMVKHDTGDYICSDPNCRWIWDKDAESPFHLKYPWWITDLSPLVLNAMRSRGLKRIPEEMYQEYLEKAERFLQPKPDPKCLVCGKVMGPFIRRTGHGRDGFCNYGCAFDHAHKDEVNENE